MALEGNEEIVLVKSLHLQRGVHRGRGGGDERVEVSVQRDEKLSGARGKVTSEGEGWFFF